MSNSVDPQAVDESPRAAGDGKPVEGSVRALWESARRAAEMIAGLRQERQALQAHIARLERELQQARADAVQIKKQASEQTKEGGISIAGGDRDLLAAKIRDLIAKLDAYL